MPDTDTINLLLATVATIVATLTGLIGAFSTSRLQNLDTEIDFLKGMILNKKFGKGKTLNDFIKGDQYHLLEKIYDPHLPAVDLLKKIILKNELDQQSNELLIDVENIRGNQLRHNQMKRLTITSFIISLIFVFISLLLLVFNRNLQLTENLFWVMLWTYLAGVAGILMLFIVQIKKLV